MKFLIIPSLFFIFLLSSIGLAFADHGSGGGGGCSGDCNPPTMGLDERSRQIVFDGFTINNDSFNVSNFEQSIPTQKIPVGKPVDITLLIHENSGAFYLSYVDLILGQKDEIISGQLIPTNLVQIVWEKTIDGEESFYVIDENNYVSDVSVESFVDGDPSQNTLTKLTFSFIPTKSFDSNPIVVNMWDYNRNSWTNYFQNALEVNEKMPYSLEEVTFAKNNDLNLPSWIKNNAGFWADNLIDDSTFAIGIKFCIENNIIHIPELPVYSTGNALHFVDVSKGPQHYIDRYYDEPSYQKWFDTNFPDYTIEEAVGLSSDSSTEIPLWIKTNAAWWSDDQIGDREFVSGIEWMISNGIIIL